MEFKRSVCICCKKKKYVKIMFATPLPTNNTEQSYCCNEIDCINSLEKKLILFNKKITIQSTWSNSLLNSITNEKQKNIKQFRIE